MIGWPQWRHRTTSTSSTGSESTGRYGTRLLTTTRRSAARTRAPDRLVDRRQVNEPEALRAHRLDDAAGAAPVVHVAVECVRRTRRLAAPLEREEAEGDGEEGAASPCTHADGSIETAATFLPHLWHRAFGSRWTLTDLLTPAAVSPAFRATHGIQVGQSTIRAVTTTSSLGISSTSPPARYARVP